MLRIVRENRKKGGDNRWPAVERP